MKLNNVRIQSILKRIPDVGKIFEWYEIELTEEIVMMRLDDVCDRFQIEAASPLVQCMVLRSKCPELGQIDPALVRAASGSRPLLALTGASQSFPPVHLP